MFVAFDGVQHSIFVNIFHQLYVYQYIPYFDLDILILKLMSTTTLQTAMIDMFGIMLVIRHTL